MEGGKLILFLKITVNHPISSCEIKKKFIFETLVILVILYGCEVWGCKISREYWRNIEQIHKRFIPYNLKIKRNTHYLIILIEVGLFPIKSMVMTRYLMYKNKINNMGNESLPKISFNSSENQLCLKWCWCKYTMAWLNHWSINENDILHNIDNINLEEVTSYKYLIIDIHHKLNWNYSIEKMINAWWKSYFGIENNCK